MYIKIETILVTISISKIDNKENAQNFNLYQFFLEYLLYFFSYLLLQPINII